jgi:SAM-dependent methyltransferase
MKEEELIALASQLKEPHGAKGTEMAAMMNETNIGMTLSSIRSLAIHDHEIVLELGPGNADHLKHILDQHTAVKYYGLETSDLMVREAKNINGHYIARAQATFLLYDGTTIPLEENYFDKIFTVNTLYFWSDPVALLSGLYKVLKPGGMLSITFAQKDFMAKLPFTRFGFELYTTEKAVTLIGQTPFTIVSTTSETEKVKSKTGELIDREYTTITVSKKKA